MDPTDRRKAPWFVAAVLVGSAGFMVLDPWPYRRPYGDPQKVAASVLDTKPVRTPRRRPELVVAGYQYRCSDCHMLFPSPPETTRPLTQHTHIVLRHGINTRCFNCHKSANRDAFVDDWGKEIPYDQPQLLCGKCHGPVYRDWLHGAHGRTNLHWDIRSGPLDRRKCVECHDPHRPPFPAIRPAPGPSTLRMGDQHSPRESPDAIDPLRIYRRSAENVERAAPSASEVLQHVVAEEPQR